MEEEDRKERNSGGLFIPLLLLTLLPFLRKENNLDPDDGAFPIDKGGRGNGAVFVIIIVGRFFATSFVF